MLRVANPKSYILLRGFRRGWPPWSLVQVFSVSYPVPKCSPWPVGLPARQLLASLRGRDNVPWNLAKGARASRITVNLRFSVCDYRILRMFGSCQWELHHPSNTNATDNHS